MNTPLVIEPTGIADSAIIWLHGLGSNKYDFEPVAKMLQAHTLSTTRFILPQAPICPVTLNNGMTMPSWYDIIDLSEPRQIDPLQLDASAQAIIKLIEEQHKQGVARKRIILAGFSQGGAVAMQTAYIAYSKTIGGVIALSTYSPTFNENTQLSDEKKTIPSLHLHGTNDPVVNINFGKAAYQFLKNHGVNASWNTYSMQHEVCNQEILDIAHWLEALLNN